MPERVPNQALLSLKGKVSVITGGAMGIGFEISRRLTEADATIVIVDINLAKGREAIRDLGLTNKHFVRADVSKPHDVERLVRNAVDRFNGIDILVSNAGIYPFKPMLDMNFDEWQRVINTNLNSTFLVDQAVARQMVSQDR